MTALVRPDEDLGPRMKALTPRARAFVLALIETGGREFARAAAIVGHTGTQGSLKVLASRYCADPAVQAALVEEAVAFGKANGLNAVATVIEIMNDPGSSKRDRLNAAGRIMHIAGMDPEETVNVKHTGGIEVSVTSQQKIADIVRMARDAGIDPRKLLGRAGIIVDAEFKEIPPEGMPPASSMQGLEDMFEGDEIDARFDTTVT